MSPCLVDGEGGAKRGVRGRSFRPGCHSARGEQSPGVVGPPRRVASWWGGCSAVAGGMAEGGGGGVRQTDGAQPPKGALVCRGLYAAPREVPVPVTVCSLQGRAVARIKERSPRSLPPLPQGDKRCHAGLDPACEKIVPSKGRSSRKSP
ncbi:hypothetical protein AAG570_008157 [Ranatra chinensis]|uniref:Uncharacterized protein n=1 Tax=Ranatra chinensis TaxID=642074 RepID=A0ABD0YCH4_9HEMI